MARVCECPVANLFPARYDVVYDGKNSEFDAVVRNAVSP
jgi:hypothetical protein